MTEPSPLPKHRVALVVFATVEGADAQDAGYVLERMLFDAMPRDRKVSLTRRSEDGSVEVTWSARVVKMMDAGMALRNGYLGAYPARKAWVEYGHEDPGPMELA